MTQRPANENVPIVVLRPTGDGAILYRALARVLVRRELISANMIADEDCESRKVAG